MTCRGTACVPVNAATSRRLLKARIIQLPVVAEVSEEKKNTPRGGIAMSVRLLVARPSELKKSIRTTCVPVELLPSTMSVDHAPPVTTCGKTNAAFPPIEAVVGACGLTTVVVVGEVTVGTGELLIVNGGEKNVAAGGGVGGTPRPKPGRTPVLDDGGVIICTPAGVKHVVTGVGRGTTPRPNPLEALGGTNVCTGGVKQVSIGTGEITTLPVKG